MEVTTTEHATHIALEPKGEMDANTSLVVDEKIQELIDAGKFNIHVDCRGLEYISSAGVGVFLSFQDELEDNGGKFVFSGMNENIYKVFELLGLNLMLKIVETEEEARKEFE